MMALGTMSIMVRLTMLKYEVMRSSIRVLVFCCLSRLYLKLTDHLDLCSLTLGKSGRCLEGRWRRLHGSHLLLVLGCPETAEESRTTVVCGGHGFDRRAVCTRRQRLARLRVYLRRLARLLAFIDNCHSLRFCQDRSQRNRKQKVTYTMPVEEIGVSSVDVAGLHRDQIVNELVRRLHTLLEKADDNSMELLLEHGISSE